ncbi:hypothetical protein Tco_1326925 [Tanacetum coccineum]
MVAYLKKPTRSEGFQEIVDFLNGSHIRYALTKNPTIYVSPNEKFWQSATVRTVDNREQEITATVNGKEFTITEASVRRHLQLANVNGISALSATEIFDQLSLMGYVLTDDKLTFQKAEKGKGSGHPSEPQPPLSTTQPTNEELIPNVVSSLHQKTQTPRVERATTTTACLDTEHASGNIHKTQSTTMPNVPFPQGIGTDGSPRCQEAMGGSIAQTRSERVPTPPYDSPLLRVNTLRSDEGNMKLQELMVLCTKLSDRVLALEIDLRQTKKVYGAAYTKLIMKVKKLDKTVNSQEDQAEDQLGVLSAAKVLADAAKKNIKTYTRRRRAVSTGSSRVSTTSRLFSTAEESVSTAGASMPVSTVGMVQEVNISIPSPVVVKDKGKGITTESEDEQTKRTKIQLEQERLGHEVVVRLQEELDEEERQRMARVPKAAQSFTEEEWENIRARIEADDKLTQRLQVEERNKYSEVDQAKMLVDLINPRKKYFAIQKAEAKRNKPMTQA